MTAANLVYLIQIAFGLSLAAHLVLLFIAPKAGADRTGRLLLLAVGCEVLWSLVNLLGLAALPLAGAAILAAELMRSTGWAIFLLSLLGTIDVGLPSPAPWVGLCRSLTLTRSAISVALAGLIGLGLSLSSVPNKALVAINLIAAVGLLVLVEQIWRNSTAGRRWGIKFIVIALLLKFGLDLVIYSDALLFNRLLGETWALRGFASALLVPLIAVAAARNAEWRLAIGVSRQVVFYSATLLISGAFLLLVAIGGYYLRLFGGNWGVVATGLLVFTALAAALVAFTSGATRARLRVLINKNFYSYRYNYREEWLRLAQLMATSHRHDENISPVDHDPADTLAHRAIEGVGSLVESTGGALWLQDGQTKNFRCEAVKNRRNPLPMIEANAPIIQFCTASDWVIDLQRGAPNPPTWRPDLLPEPIASDPLAAILVPLRLDNQLVGLLLLDSLRIQFPMNWEVYDMLKIAAHQVASYLAVRRSTEALLMAQEFDTFNRMSAFVVHDLKNQISQLSLILRGAEKHSHDPEYQQDVLATVKDVFQQMQALLLQLNSGKRRELATDSVNLFEVLQQVTLQRRRENLEPQLIFEPAMKEVRVEADRERLVRSIGNLVQNALDATPAGGNVQVQVNHSTNDQRVTIEVSDTGDGMSESFIRTRLFKPFVSTKESGMGVGAFESLEFFRQIGGSLDVSSRPGEGSHFRIELPIHTSAKG